MKAETNSCRFQLRACNKQIGVQLAIAFLIGLLTQQAFIGTCFATDEAGPPSDSVLTAAMPEEGAPPAPAVASDAQASSAVQAEESPAASANDKATAESSLPAETSAAAAPADSASGSSFPGERAGDIASEVRELSVSPQTKPLLPEGRPSWVGAPPDLSNPRRHRLFVGSFPTSSIDEVDAALDEPMLAAVNGYIDEEVLQAGGAAHLNITADFIRRNLLDSSTEYVAELNTSPGPAYQKWVVLEITPDHRQHFLTAHREFEQRKRLVGLGLGVASVLGLTGVAHLAFNRRRRRYAQVGRAVVHAVPAEPDPMAAKGNNRVLWLLAGSVGSLAMLGTLLLGSVWVVHEVRAPDSVIIGSEQVIMRAEPPIPPTPPLAPEIYIDAASIDSEVEGQPEEYRSRANAWRSVEHHRRVNALRSDRD